jgi:hypothetical protein
VSDNDLNSVVLLLWDRLRLDARFELALDEVFDESADLLLGELVALKGIFLILDSFLNGEGRERFSREVQVSSMRTEGFGIDDSHVEFALVLLSNRLEGLSELGSLFRGFCEDVR